ncbi:fibrinogen C domain-containing protein 1-A [Aplysia californica]|uniref:Fibrinogen C domain-containing protein 1-A n=1 Tax=Aplysia californica TaxID=6500 RepID=A0ABM0K943_APLCA|nr:fibrinogen C domain-containing protein 1-A [Aplysia californica]
MSVADVALDNDEIDSLPRACIDVAGGQARHVVTMYNGMEVLCDTETESGGWIVFQRRTSRNVSFYHNWASYKYGFGDLTGDFWLGLEKVHKLTANKRHEMRLDFITKNTSYYASYDRFRVLGNKENYTIFVSGYWGNAVDHMSGVSGQAFSANDRDNDLNKNVHCADQYHAGWWYTTSCNLVNPNGRWATHVNKADGLDWSGYSDPITFVEMKIRPVDNHEMCPLYFEY